MSDRTLVARARAGDVHAFGVLLERHRPALERACRHRLRDRGLAADVAQDAALTAWLQLERLQDPSRFGAWLAGIGRVLSLRALRELGGLRELPTSDGAVPDGPGSTRDDPAARVLAAERAAELAGAIAALPPGQRDAVVLLHLADQPQPTIAARLGAVRTRLHKARATLRARLTTPEELPVPDVVPATIADVLRTPAGRHVVLLDCAGTQLPIWVGRPEAEALVVGLQGIDLPRPSGHALMLSLLAAAGERPAGVRITRLSGGVFHAEVRLAGGAAVDARPSDALVLAVSSGVPVEVDAAVLRATADGPPDAYAGDLAQAEPGGAGRIAVELRRQLAELEAELAAVRDDR